MLETMQVKATPGLKCPKEGQPRSYITDSEAVSVPKSAYYLRLLNDGSLIRIEETETK